MSPVPGSSYENHEIPPSEIRTSSYQMKQRTSAPNGFSFIEPMKALPVEKLPEGDWLYEIKFDGYRALAFKDGKNVRLISRNKRNSTTLNRWMP
jgi:bifunctional non-homologous end joining protein LigD